MPGREKPAQESGQSDPRSEDAALRANRQQEHDKRAEVRRTLVGSGDRSQRIRTYNFPENRITDHRINLTLYKLDQILQGNLQPIIDQLIEFDRQEIRGSLGPMD